MRRLSLIAVSFLAAASVYAGAPGVKPVGKPKASADVIAALHGHLGPFVAIGSAMGGYAVERLGIETHFDARVLVEGPDRQPQSCLVDGLQASTGATYGKRSIHLIPAESFTVRIENVRTGKALTLRFSDQLNADLAAWRESKVDLDEQASRILAADPKKLFVEVK